MKLLNGVGIIIIAQIISFIQLQGQVKWPRAKDHPLAMMLFGLPIGYMSI